jgi:hypothetical protein
VARARPEEKGGRDTASTIGAEPTDHGLQRRELVAEPLGDAIEWLTIHEDRPEGFGATVESLLGLEEEAAGRGSLHDAAS